MPCETFLELLTDYFWKHKLPTTGDTHIGQFEISVCMAEFLIRNYADPIQSKDIYDSVSKCLEYRKFSYLYGKGLHERPDLLDAEDRKKVSSLRAEDSPTLASLLPTQDRPVKPAMNINIASMLKSANAPVQKKRVPVPAKRFGIPKRNKGR